LFKSTFRVEQDVIDKNVMNINNSILFFIFINLNQY
jgi:hypothetical protein